jgi:hypothetical protein
MEKKHLVFIIALLAIGFAAYLLFGPDGKTVTVEKLVYVDSSTGKQVPIQKASTNDVCLNYENYSPSELPTNLINDLVGYYRENQLQAINGNALNSINNDAHSIWFDIDTIKKFIYNIERGVINNNATGSSLGIRIYYAAYPDSTIFASKNALKDFNNDPYKIQFGKKHTLVMLPTITKNGKIWDFNPSDPKSFGGFNNMNTKEEPELFYKQSPKPLMALTGSTNPPLTPSVGKKQATIEELINARNHGQLAPPYPTDGEAF